MKKLCEFWFLVGLLFLATGLCSVSVTARADIVSNGSFEVPDVPVPPAHIYNPIGAVWTFTGAAGIVNTAGNWTFEPPIPVPDGTQIGFLQYETVGNNPGRFSQIVTLPATGGYMISYMVGGRQKIDNSGPNGGRVDGDLSYQVLLDGNVIASDATVSFQPFTARSYRFVATAGSHTLTFAATSTSGDHTAFFDAIKVQNPIADAGADQTVNCGPQRPVTVTLDGSASSDPDGDPLEFVWTVPAGSPVTLANANNAVTTATIPATQSGDYPILLTVTDGKGGTDTDEVVIKVVVDGTPPDITCWTDEVSLWPPNHQIVEVTLLISASDGDVTAECASSEPDDANGDGEFTGDVNGGDGFSAPQPIALSYDVTLECYVGTLRLRAERDGSETGRTYSIVCTATNPYGNSSTARCAVLVPHDRRRN